MADEQAQTVLQVEGFRLDAGRGSLFDPRGAALALRPKSFDLLTYLFRNAGRIVSREELLEAIWPGVFVGDDSITQCVAEIRRVLGPDGTHLLRTLPKRGYILAATAIDLKAEAPDGSEAAPEVQQAPLDLARGERSPPQDFSMERRLAAILTADIAGYSRLISLDEAGTFRRVKTLRAEVFEPAVMKHRGRIVSYAGDGALAEFPSVIRAVECALAIQKVMVERELEVSPERRFALRMGIHSGDIIVDADSDLCGDAVNIAARLEKLAEPGGICLSDRAYDEMAGRIDAVFAYGGEQPLKNIGREVGVWFWPPSNHGGRASDLTSTFVSAARSALKDPRLNARWPEIFGNVPPQDLNFIGREEALSSLHRLLMQGGRPAAVTQAAIHGLGGIGKTTLAAEYAHRHASDYAGVWWAPAENRAGLIASLVDLAGRLDARLAEEPDQEKAAQAGLAHLARSDVPYLLIYDNVETPEVLCDLLPRAGARVILTTRWSDWSGRADELDLPLLDPYAAVDLLRTRGGRPNDPGAARLAEVLGRLPLALDHAGAYCRLTGMSFDAYRQRLDQVIARTPRGVTYLASIRATFELAVDKAAAECPATERLLGLCAYLAPERIPLDLIGGGVADEEEQAEALMTLTAVSLVEHVELEGGEPAITIHRLVQAAMRARLAERGQTEMTIERATRRLTETFPKTAYTDTKVWPRCAELLPHVLALREWLPASSGSEEVAELYHAAGSYLLGRGAYVEAEPLFNEGLAIIERTLGREHLAVATLMHRLASLYRESGRYAEAEPLFNKALAIKETILGREHHEVALELTNLAYLYHDTDRCAEAEPLHKEAIAIGRRTLGREHHLVAMYLNNLAHLYHDIGRHAEAEPLYKEAIAIGEQALGREHSYMALFLTGLARLYRDTDRYAEAEPLFNEAIAIGERTLGREHRVTARARQYFATLLLILGRGEEALSQGSAALQIYNKRLGMSHRRTMETAGTCAAALTSLGRSAEASTLLARYGPPLTGGS